MKDLFSMLLWVLGWQYNKNLKYLPSDRNYRKQAVKYVALSFVLDSWNDTILGYLADYFFMKYPKTHNLAASSVFRCLINYICISVSHTISTFHSHFHYLNFSFTFEMCYLKIYTLLLYLFLEEGISYELIATIFNLPWSLEIFQVPSMISRANVGSLFIFFPVATMASKEPSDILLASIVINGMCL